MSIITSDVVVAGHICLDIIPEIRGRRADGRLLVPGGLTEVGPAAISTGGVVSNTGLALYRLGVPVRLVGKVGGDLFGRAVMDIVAAQGKDLTRRMIISPDETTSYTVVINPPGVDRFFYHCPGANDTFEAADVAAEGLRGARLFHFGYPPIMKRMWQSEGEELERLLAMVKAEGLTTSLDMTQPDPESPSGRADWRRLLSRVLPLVDLFLPSLDETLFMLDRERFESLSTETDGRLMASGGLDLPARLADELLDIGCAIVALKLGDSGMYLRTSKDPSRWERLGACRPDPLAPWLGRELYTPCFAVEVQGTTGAGDCANAGFITSMLRDLSPEAAITRACAVGACNVERPDATSGILPWSVVEQRLAAGWPRLEPACGVPSDWREAEGVWSSPRDGR